jgi:uncharacterized protein YggU (UPF0235/DUF167 family)
MRISVRAHPGASRDRLAWDGAVLHVWVTARAVEGAANRALLKAVAHGLEVRPAAVRLAGGDRSRDKAVEVDGLDAHVLERLGRRKRRRREPHVPAPLSVS